LLKIKTFGHVIKYYDTLFHYDIVSGIHLYRLSYVWNLILAHIWDAHMNEEEEEEKEGEEEEKERREEEKRKS
jgi:hypothetical protein